MTGNTGVAERCGVLFGAILCLLTTTRPFRHRPDALWLLIQLKPVDSLLLSRLIGGIVRAETNVLGDQVHVLLRRVGEDFADGVQVAEAVFPMGREVVAFAPLVPVVEQRS